VGWTPSLVVPQQGGLLSGLGPAERRPAHALRSRPQCESRVTETARELGHRICSDGWQDAVAWRLSGALDEAGWSLLRRRPAGLCRRLAGAAKEIEEASVLLGEAAGLATVEGLRWLKRTRLVQKVAQTAVEKVVPADGEGRPRAVAHCLLITGVWLCVADGEPLRGCTCFETLARGRSSDWVCGELDRHLTGLRAAAPGE
jgi:hypothetical protein